MSALKYWVWLSSLDISAEAKYAVINHYGDAEQAFFAHYGDFDNVERISARDREILEKRDMSKVNDILGKCELQNLQIVTFADAGYPKRLKQIYCPPVVLYVRGRLPAVDENAVIAVVGTRNASPYGIKMSRSIAFEIAKCGGIIASGLTRGIDATAAEGALTAGGTVIGVLGTPHEKDSGRFFLDIAAKGAVISEYPPFTEHRNYHFRERNRITAGLSVGVVAVEAPEGSGTRLFVTEANEQGKEIFAVPGNADSPNSFETNAMIKEGAKPVTCGWDVLEEFSGLYPLRPAGSVLRLLEKTEEMPICAAPEKPYRAEKKPDAEHKATKKEVDKPKDKEYIDLQEQLSKLNEDQLKIIAAVEKSASHIDDIIEATGLSAARVLSQLTVLEIKGFIHREAGKRIALNISKK
ncbi:MAG: DNA-processing protein DprA [Eubacteriales bacterium]|nr:DNA-processing protein DprA [Eubacteriales bacterium]